MNGPPVFNDWCQAIVKGPTVFIDWCPAVVNGQQSLLICVELL